MDYPKSVPNVGLVDGHFVDENPVTGQVGSLIPASWGDALTREILNVIADAGLPANEFDVTQLKQAINLKINYATRQASEAVIGTIAVASQTQTDGGERHDVAVTPKTLAKRLTDLLPNATTSLLGRIRLAAQSEVDNGLDDSTAVTPAKLKWRLEALLPDATTVLLGRVRLATKPMMDAGVDDATAVTPKKLIDRLGTYIVQATEAAFGWSKVATQAQVNAGVDDTAFITSKKARWGFASVFGTNSYIVLPEWLGGWILQFGITPGLASGSVGTVNFPLSFTTAVRFISLEYVDGASNVPASRGGPTQVGANNLSFFNYSHSGSASGAQHFWFAVGK